MILSLSFCNIKSISGAYENETDYNILINVTSEILNEKKYFGVSEIWDNASDPLKYNVFSNGERYIVSINNDTLCQNYTYKYEEDNVIYLSDSDTITDNYVLVSSGEMFLNDIHEPKYREDYTLSSSANNICKNIAENLNNDFSDDCSSISVYLLDYYSWNISEYLPVMVIIDDNVTVTGAYYTGEKWTVDRLSTSISLDSCEDLVNKHIKYSYGNYSLIN